MSPSVLEFSLFVVVALAVSTVTHIYVLGRLCAICGRPPGWRGLVAIAVYVLVYAGVRTANETLHIEEIRAIAQTINFVTGWVLLALVLVLAHDIFWVPLRFLSLSSSRAAAAKAVYDRWSRSIGISMVAVISLSLTWGILNFMRPVAVDEIKICSPKIDREYRLLHFSDLQFGSVGPGHVVRARELIDRLMLEGRIDLALNTGDHIDTSNYVREDLSPLGQLPFVSLFSLGNHEFYHGTESIISMQQSFGVEVLRSGNRRYGRLNIIGIDDSRDPGQVARVLKENSGLVRPDSFNILMYHRPRGVLDARELGIDLMLVGHTHGGQLFPYTLLVSSLFGFPQGVTRLGDFVLYITDGLGIWGPRVRLGSRNELALITLCPE